MDEPLLIQRIDPGRGESTTKIAESGEVWDREVIKPIGFDGLSCFAVPAELRRVYASEGTSARPQKRLNARSLALKSDVCCGPTTTSVQAGRARNRLA